MSANPLDIRLRGLDDLILESVKRIESLETTRAFHADTLKRIADRVDKLSEAFRARTDELAGLLESAINLGQHQAAQQTDSNLRLGVSMDALQESLIRLQHDTANRIAELRAASNNEKNTPEFIRYVHADDLRAVIREVIKELPMNPYRTR